MKFDVVLADPPWSYTPSTHTNDVTRHYGTMSQSELLKFPWNDYVGNVLFMWATCPLLSQAIHLGEGIGLHYRGVAFVWVKTSSSGKPWGARGVRPSVVKPTTEMVLTFSRSKSGRPLKLSDESIVQTVFAPVGKHSEKPEEVQDRIDLMYPSASKCELFARRSKPGWYCWGNELLEEVV